jgi:hypothetical protein
MTYMRLILVGPSRRFKDWCPLQPHIEDIHTRGSSTPFGIDNVTLRLSNAAVVNNCCAAGADGEC